MEKVDKKWGKGNFSGEFTKVEHVRWKFIGAISPGRIFGQI